MTAVEDEEVTRRIRIRCAAATCRWFAVMTWHGVPFCANHAPVRRPGASGWERL